MVKFKDYIYERPDMDLLKSDMNKLFEGFNEVKSANEQIEKIREINKLRNRFETMKNIVEVRNSMDTTDPYYEKENDFMDENLPIYQEIVSNYYKLLVDSKYAKEIEETYGKQILNIAKTTLESFSSEIISELQEENKLKSKYSKLRASARIIFQGEEYNIEQMIPFMQDVDREVRKNAHKAVSGFFKEKQDEFDQIYDGMVKLRHSMAKKLGYDNFVPLGYKRLNRVDYNFEDVKKYREKIIKYVVPVASKLREKQAKRLGISALKYYDEALEFLTGNASPKGNPDWILDKGRRMYSEMSRETDEFFKFMESSELMDLVSRKGKSGGGYCTYINDYKAPFIFSNFNGTSGDVDVLTHEAGHAFQGYSSRDFELPEYYFPTLEACEIHSMSMEFLAWPWMELFFEEEEAKYKFSHLSGTLLFLPYGALVDEFQHFVYENPNVSPEERRSEWRKLEERYLPTRDYDGDEFMEAGGFWFKQGHLFSDPFYYIDYTLAQVSALEFWMRSSQDRESAFKDYLELCKKGGSLPYLSLVESAKLNNPFEGDIVKEVIEKAEEWLSKIDDQNL